MGTLSRLHHRKVHEFIAKQKGLHESASIVLGNGPVRGKSVLAKSHHVPVCAWQDSSSVSHLKSMCATTSTFPLPIPLFLLRLHSCSHATGMKRGGMRLSNWAFFFGKLDIPEIVSHVQKERERGKGRAKAQAHRNHSTSQRAWPLLEGVLGRMFSISLAF